jgi:hypothetical protein
MKTNILNFSLLLLFILSMSACKKRERKYRYYGYVYNSIDSTPFKNTNFKLWEKGNTYGKNHETPFVTNNNGFFDITNSGGEGSSVAWPSYVDAAGYLGPILMLGTKDQICNSDGTLCTITFDTVYITPYH